MPTQPSYYEDARARYLAAAGGADPLAALYGQQPRTPQAAAQIPLLTPEEESSELGRLAGLGLSGLGYLGASLGKAFGGRAIRGALGGNPRELLSIIPFSDFLNITKPEQEVHGANLLGGDDDTPFFSPQGIGGFALDVALDPLTYLSLGTSASLRPAGIAAKKAGLALPKTGAELANTTLDQLLQTGGAPARALVEKSLGGAANLTPELLASNLGGNVGLGFPFMGVQKAFDVSPLLGSIKSTLEPLAKWVPLHEQIGEYGGQLWRGGKAMFQKRLKDQTSVIGQKLAGNISDVESLARQKATEDFLPMLQARAGMGANAFDDATALRLNDVFEGAAPKASLTPAEQQLYGMWDNIRQKYLQEEQQVGLTGSMALAPQEIPHGIGKGQQLEMLPRQFAPEVRQPIKRGPTLAPGQDKGRVHTYGLTKNSLNELTQDVTLENLSRLNLHEEIGTRYLGLPKQGVIQDKRIEVNAYNSAKSKLKAAQQRVGEAVTSGLPPIPQDITDIALAEAYLQANGAAAAKTAAELEKIEPLVKYAESLADMRLNGSMHVFNQDPMYDIYQKMVRDQLGIYKAKEVHKGIAEMAYTLPSGAKASADHVPLMKMLDDANLSMNTVGMNVSSNNPALGSHPTTGAMMTLQQELRKLGKDPDKLLDFYVPKEGYEAVTKLMTLTSGPEGMKPFLEIFDGLTNVNKAWQTVPWIPNHVRNQGTAALNHWLKGAYDPTASGFMSYVKPFDDARALRETGVLKDANQIPHYAHLSPAEATAELQRDMVRHNVRAKHAQIGREGLEDVGGMKVLQDMIPDARRPGLTDPLKALFPANKMDWLEVTGVHGGLGISKDKGVFRYTDDVHPLAKWGRETASVLDDLNRESAYIAFLRQGYSPAAAAEKTMLTHYDFSNLSGFEKTWPRRLVPFYNWMRQNIPAMVTEIIENPGGKASTLIRAAGQARGTGKNSFTPEYLGEGVALKLGDETPEGVQRYLSQTGLPVEDLAQVMSGRGILGQLNPLLKMPLELSTGKQFFSGRDLADLHSLTGNTYNDELLANSPLSRLSTTMRTLLDPRKGLLAKGVNVLTGVRLTDVDMEKAKNVAVRDLIEDQLRGNPNVRSFERLSVRPENLPNLTPEEFGLLQLYRTREQAARRRQSVSP